MNKYTPTIRPVEEAEAGFGVAIDRILRWDSEFAPAGSTPDEKVANSSRQAMVETARRYAVDCAVAQVFYSDEVVPSSAMQEPNTCHILSETAEVVLVDASSITTLYKLLSIR